MSDLKCVVEGCDMEYDVTCSFSFYNSNTTAEEDAKRQEWIDGAMHEESELLWRHVSLQLCGYHFELDQQGLWIDSPMLPDLLAVQENKSKPKQSAEDKKLAEMIRTEHNYSAEPPKQEPPETISRLNVRQLVDTLGYLSLKNMQRKQLWVVKVETEKVEASITQSEQVITKMPDPRLIEIIPQAGASSELSVLDEPLPDNFIYEIAEEQEIAMDEVKEIVSSGGAGASEWTVNIFREGETEEKPKYAYIKHCSGGRKKRHFTADMSEITLQGDFENYYILPDVDPSSSVEVSTSLEPPAEDYVVHEYEHLVLDTRQAPKRRAKPQKRKKPKLEPKEADETPEWSLDVYDEAMVDYDDKKQTPRVRRKNNKYLGYDFVT